MPLDDLVLLPETHARRLLPAVKLRVLAPLGAYAGRGVLRVLRARPLNAEAVELVCGYESYEPL